MKKVSVIACPNLAAPVIHGRKLLLEYLKKSGFEVVELNEIKFNIGNTIMIGDIASPIFYRMKGIPSISVSERRESFSIVHTTAFGNRIICVLGADSNGLMYGCFELMEKMEMLEKPWDIFDNTEPVSQSPEIPFRGIQTFLHNADLEKGWYYSREYWNDYFDLLAQSRYNQFNLIFGHQTSYLIPIYPFMFDVEGYPQVKAKGLSKEDQDKNLEMFRYISKTATERGIKFFLGIWQSIAWDTQEKMVEGVSKEILPHFTAKAVSQLLKLCPDVMGLQLRMNNESGINDQKFFTDVFIPAVEECGREIEFDIRNWGLEPATLKLFCEAHPNMRVSMKYYAEHQGMPYQPALQRGGYSYDSLLRNDRSYNLSWHHWNLGTHRIFLWGNPDYTKLFVKSCHLGDAVSFEVTPPLSQKGFSQYEHLHGYWNIYKEGVDTSYYNWEFQKYWFFYKAWGRIGYNADLSDNVWINELAKRFNKNSAPHLLTAYKEASKVISYLITHHMDDKNMYIWLELDTGGTIDKFAQIQPGEELLFYNARLYAKHLIEGKLTGRKTPFEAADDLDQMTRKCRDAFSKAEKLIENKNAELQISKIDFTALSQLAEYNAQKIRASTYLTLFYLTDCYDLLQKAGEHAGNGLAIWKELCKTTEPYYERLSLGPTGGHWKENLVMVEHDLNRVMAVERIFKEYGSFKIGFDFGGTLSDPPSKTAGFDDDLVEKRFVGIDSKTAYSKEKGYGWATTDKLFEECFIKGEKAEKQKNWTEYSYELRGAKHVRSFPTKHPDFPVNNLTSDYVGSKSPNQFLADLPNGRYQVMFLIGDKIANPRKHGKMSISMAGNPVLSDYEIPVGKVETHTYEVLIKSGKMVVDLSANQGEWIIAGIIVRPYAPIISHLKPYAIIAEDDFSVNVTVTSPSKIKKVTLFFKEGPKGKIKTVPMHGKDMVYSMKIPKSKLKKGQIRYWFEAVNDVGLKTSYPEKGVKGPVELPVFQEYRKPCVATHDAPKVHEQKKNLPLIVSISNPETITELRLHYRAVDQNAEYKTLSMKRKGNVFFGVIPGSDIDCTFDLMYYFEGIDVLGHGLIYPDGFTEPMYKVVKIVSSD